MTLILTLSLVRVRVAPNRAERGQTGYPSVTERSAEAPSDQEYESTASKDYFIHGRDRSSENGRPDKCGMWGEKFWQRCPSPFQCKWRSVFTTPSALLSYELSHTLLCDC